MKVIYLNETYNVGKIVFVFDEPFLRNWIIFYLYIELPVHTKNLQLFAVVNLP
jgi:hypothetical protein